MKKVILCLFSFYLIFHCKGQVQNTFRDYICINSPRLEVTNTAGSQSFGTAFFFQYIFGVDTIITTVTNYHLVKDAKYFDLTLALNNNKDTKSRKYCRFRITDIKWIKHPTEDIAILIWDDSLKRRFINENKAALYITFIDSSYIPDQIFAENLTAIENVFMVGNPVGFYDVHNNIPIVRNGITATPYYLNYDNKNRFLVDFGISTGSSGSPIFLCNESPTYANYGYLSLDGPQHCLLGIACEDITDVNPFTSNIGVAIKSSCLLDFQPIIKKMLYKSNDQSSPIPTSPISTK